MFDLLSCGSNRIFFVIELFAILFEAARWAAPSWPCELFEQADERALAKFIRCFRQAEPISQTAAETEILSAAGFGLSRAGILSGVAVGAGGFFRRVTMFQQQSKDCSRLTATTPRVGECLTR